MIDYETLESIGLTKSEAKVYVTLLRLGPSTKKAIIADSGISSSKLYDVTDRLIQKGIVTFVKENKVLHFSASKPTQLIEILRLQKKKIEEQEEKVRKLIPSLSFLNVPVHPEVKVFRGWKGLRSAYFSSIESLRKGDVYHVLGVTGGQNPELVDDFFIPFHKERFKRGIKVRMVVGKKDKGRSKNYLNSRLDSVKYIDYRIPSEIAIFKDHVLITILTKTPIVTSISDPYVRDSFKFYFEDHWKNASVK